MTGSGASSVRVAMRIRPQNAREKIDVCQVCTSVMPGEPQVCLGKDKMFTFDFVFDMDSTQEQIYNTCSHELIEGCLEGYNATIFAYGQTGSGKTYSMGTGFDVNIPPECVGIIPRAVGHLFTGITSRRQIALDANNTPPDFKVTAQFMELYNEEIIDLLDTTRDPSERNQKSHIKIHEDAGGGIYTYGTTIRPVTSLDDTMQCLKIGSLSRTTASTNMNSQSSRSHAIFTLEVRQQRVVPGDVDKTDPQNQQQEKEFESLKAKFHFVDLAGSERLKRTGATGERAKEGISINCGLLALGNVISALGDKLKKGCHVPYRDSKLTRLLQDSLGGNSRTVMIACVSPCDRDFMETLNTLKYANRARNIENKVVVNQDKTSRQIASLKSEINQLREELLEYKQGKRIVGDDGLEVVNDMFHENTMLQTDNNNLRQRIKSLQATIEALTQKNASILAERAVLNIKNMAGDAGDDEIGKLVQNYVQQIEELRTKLLESETLCEDLRRAAMRSPRTPSRLSTSPLSCAASHLSPGYPDNNVVVNDLLQLAKTDVEQLKVKEKRSISRQKSHKTLKEQQTSENEKDVNEAEDDENALSEDEENIDNKKEGTEDDCEEENDLDEVDEEEDSNSDSELDDEDDIQVHENLAELTCEISIKQQLIDRLERSQKELHTMKLQYEEKLKILQAKIQSTETERDQVLSNLDKIEHSVDGKAQKIRDQYQHKISDMQREMKKLQAAKREHTKQMRDSSQYESQLITLKSDLAEMKRTKVKLMNQIKEGTKRYKMAEAQKMKQVNLLQKQQRAKDNKIKTLEAETKQKDARLKRKQEEVESLKRQQKPLSKKASGRVYSYNRPSAKNDNLKIPVRRADGRKFSEKLAKQKWDKLEKTVTSVVAKKKTVSLMEKDMNMRLKEREKLNRHCEKLKLKLDSTDEKDEAELKYEIEKTNGHLERLQDDIQEFQSNIMELIEAKSDEPMSLIAKCSSDEARYLLEHLLALVIDKGLLAAQKAQESKQLALKLGKVKRKNSFHASLLQFVLNESNPDMELNDELLTENDEDDEDSNSDSDSSSPYDCILDQFLPDTTSTPAGGRNKARRKTATPEELLYPLAAPLASVLPPVIEEINVVKKRPASASTTSSATTTTTSKSDEKPMIKSELPDCVLMPPPKSLPIKPTQSAKSSSSARGPVSRSDPSPIFRRKTYSEKSTPEPSPTFRRKAYNRQTSTDSDIVPNSGSHSNPSSPTRERPTVNSSDNVFSRLTSQTCRSSTQIQNKGSIRSVKTSSSSPVGPLVFTHKVEGHSSAVLSVHATDDLLFTGGKDQLAKVWDLNTCQLLTTLSGHPHNVTTVKYCSQNKLLYSVSSYLIKVWDPRASKCVQSLCSSGQVQSSHSSSTSSRMVSLPTGEMVINDIAPCRNGKMLFTAAGNLVRLWDLRKYSPIGKLSGGHQAAVMALAVEDSHSNVTVVTGSKDHYIKVFQFHESANGVLTPFSNLEPPHYDGIQSLALNGTTLFSGSRDMCIKKWDLHDQQLKHSINSAHKDWVCGLTFLPNGESLLSGCRSGYLKLWSVDDCSQISDIKAHNSPINAITTNSTCIFSASNDSTVGIWQRFDNEIKTPNSDKLRFNTL
ncbi:kinesin-like protein KIF21A [Tubulanus polymorphus]|uniref:kinesin-like protein KIF21A n=1 Tax=Tubulanus polymorphus TaxID=672921 RepID=UPI003DA45E51